MFATQLTNQRQSRSRKQHFLADRRGIGDVGDGGEGVGRGGAEEDVSGFVGLEERVEGGEVGGEGGGGGEGGFGDEGFGGDGCEEGAG